MAVSNRYSAISGSFMFLSFLTAALLIAVQGQGLLANSETYSSAESAVTSETSDLQLAPDLSSHQPFLATSTVSPTAANQAALQVGIADILSSALHPVALIHRPELVVDLSDRQVLLYKNGVLQVQYGIAVGKEGWETPIGSFQILSMQENPVWQNPITGETVTNVSENPLGSRWIGFWTDGKHQIGFHGTNQEELIGQAVSHGCIRMRDPEIQALFTQVTPGTPVIVQP